jgi:Skp family chaperone for outer membrane proteins
MKMMFTKRLAVALIGAALCMSASVQAADVKIGLVDLKKVFDGYYKTKEADVKLKERVADAEKVMKGMGDDYQKATEEYKKLIDGSNDQAVSSDEREKRKKGAESKLMEVQEIERNVKQFRTQTSTTLEEQKRRMREEILRLLRETIATHAKKGGYTHVFDTASESIAQTSVILYTNGQGDMTDDILTEINANAPAGSDAKAEPKPDAKLQELLNQKPDPNKKK